ncbi:MAG: DUF1566 domain-containing protein, partial [Treponema sp.]|nr:DUF1566 domain-containing protein [Treponema sp.]
KKNTAAIVAFLNRDGQTGAAQICVDLHSNGFNDWFLPSKGELGMMYRNLKMKNLGGFKDAWYWSSSQSDNSYAWRQNFSDGEQAGSHPSYKTYGYSVRAIRQF